MKTTENSTNSETSTKHTSSERVKVLSSNISPSKSVRPQKSMMRLQSLKPKRLQIATKVNVKKVLS